MILVDTSAWVEFLRATGSPAHLRVRELLESNDAMATSEVIVMEVLAGARDDAHLRGLRGLLLRCDLLPLRGLADYEDAAQVYRLCRRAGETVRSLTDCLIAVVAVRTGTELLHADRDYPLIARHVPLITSSTPAT